MHRLFTRFLLTVIVALFSRAAFADPDLLLYFQIVDQPQFDNGGTCSYDFAMVSFTMDGTNPSGEYLDLYADGETVSQGQALASGSDAAYASLGRLGSNPTMEIQILFELWSASGDSFERVGYYTALYSELTGHIMESGGVSQATPLMITQVHAQAVPEPTSGLLVLLGAAVLALRRKRI